MPVTLTKPLDGRRAGDTYSGPNEAWLVANGYADREGGEPEPPRLLTQAEPTPQTAALPMTLGEPATLAAYPPLPKGHDVAAFLGSVGDMQLSELAGRHLDVVIAMARSYVRGNGFTDTTAAADLVAVIITATARLVANPEQIAQEVGPLAIRGGFAGWNLAETFVLNAYRGRAS